MSDNAELLKQLLMQGFGQNLAGNYGQNTFASQNDVLLQLLQRAQQQPQFQQPQQQVQNDMSPFFAQALGILAQQQQNLVQSPQGSRQVKVPKRKSNIVKENDPPVEYPVKSEANPGNMSSSMTSLKLNIDQQQDHHLQPLSSTTSIDEGVHTSSSSPTETHSGPVSPLDSDCMNMVLPKEHENADRKRPAAISELLNSKKRRLELKKEADDEHPADWHGVFPQNPEDDTETISSNCSVKNEENKKENIDNSVVNPSELMASLFSTPQVDSTLDESTAKTDMYSEIPADWNLASSSGDVYEAPNSKDIPHDQTFAMVPGRLSLLSNVTKYKMTVAEIRRRVLGPECFNFSLLGALLRRAKMPEKSQALFNELQEVGLQIPRGRRRNYSVTLMSALTEAEAEQMVNDFARVSEDKFPCKEFVELSYATIRRNVDAEKLFQRAKELEATKKVLNEFLELMKMDRSEIRDLKPTPILPESLQSSLSTYSMLTHGFGNAGMQVGIRMLGSFVDKQMEMLRNDIQRIYLIQQQQQQLQK